tara:strand:- start:1500 stop:1613 length:114 start_codon:yes stop_codon:yes gene_type:complete
MAELKAMLNGEPCQINTVKLVRNKHGLQENQGGLSNE